MQTACDFLNRRFMTFHTKHRPYIILKWAQSADGFFAPEDGRQFWLTNEYSKTQVHKWRAEEDAILVGTRTALIDDPQLTARMWQGRNPTRLLIDLDLKAPESSRIFDEEAMTLVYNAKKEGLDAGNAYVKINREENVPQQIMADLYHRKVLSVIIEGGAYTINQFIATGLWDEARIFTSPAVMTSGIPAPDVHGVIHEEQDIAGDSLIIKLNSSL
jgi:diaminohydroxyphosphoribosylaminopyrimidine deaminase/5-amino-6-(5-phosphoribosylamino)uracil reductase